MPGDGQKKMDYGVNTLGRSERRQKPGTKHKKPLGTKGALLYIVSDHVVRPSPAQEPPLCGGWPPKRLAAARCTELHRLQHLNVETGCVTCVPYKGLQPLRRSATILAPIGNKHGSDEPYLFPISFIKTTIEGGLFYVSI